MSPAALREIPLPAPEVVMFELTEMFPAVEDKLALPPRFQEFGRVSEDAVVMDEIPPAERLDRKAKLSAFEAAGLTNETEPVPVAFTVVFAVAKSNPRRAPECC
jgi:hypothetical protein